MARLANSFSHCLKPGAICLMHGEMGAGKTFFTGHIFRALGGDPRYFSSPTYNIVNRYPLPDSSEFIHVDLYRLERVDEQDAIDQELWDKSGSNFVFVEWPERLTTPQLGPGYRIHLEHLATGRRVRFESLDLCHT